MLGLRLVARLGSMAVFDLGNARLFLAKDNDGDDSGRSLVYFSVDDIEAAHQALASRGVTFTGAPHMVVRNPDGSEEWMAFFEDPDGSLLALMSRVPPAKTR